MKAQKGRKGVAVLFLKLRVRWAWVPNAKAREFYRRFGEPQGRSVVKKISPPPGFEPGIIQPVSSRYTDCAVPAR
jgi:hypothetical protein